MKTELAMPDGRKWIRLTGRSDARSATKLSKTHVPEAWVSQHFLLLSPDGQRADVIVYASGPNVVVNGHGQQNPYPDHSAAIAALSKHLGVPFPPPPMGHKEAAAIIEEARAATPYWKWEPTRVRKEGPLIGYIHIGRLKFRIGFFMAGKIAEIHWGTEGVTTPALETFQKRAGLFPKIAICMRDMIADFLAKGHTDTLYLMCASDAHARHYMEYLSSCGTPAYTFEPMRDKDEVFEVRFNRDQRRRRHRFDRSAFRDTRRTPAEFADLTPRREQEPRLAGPAM